jgi:phosphothreonine lyase
VSAAALNPASLGPAVATGGGRPATEEAGNKIPTIQVQMGQLPPSTFSPGTNVPAYETFQNGSYKQSSDKPESPEIKNEDYHFHPDPQGFTEANRTSGPGSNSKFEGQKIHISVDPNDPKKAYDALAPLLFSPDSPIDRFKMTNMGEAQGAANDAATRVSQGAQFTLYLKPNQDGKFDAEHLKKIQSFVGEAETRLQQGGVGHGTVPNTDAALPGQGYASFRTEEAERTQQGAEKVKQDPVYQLLNHP